ncbi:hypothetical protein [Stutzerimonas stutzeri]|uniref:hypothetical protein n=1 Tax=Stutzerimonas stutzeri TaxID=316 RepID=UPI00265CC95F|nr:hypothetical protein [Stutzerimonas stutzeri]MCF6783392.1 hypothetical protein [Stutzerimonas stutzeri]
MTKPTQQVYEELQKAYEFFNQELFDGRLPSCVITLQRQHDTYGYFSANQFQSRVGGQQAHEIALNPSYFAVRTIHETLSVLVREMVSLDQTLNTKRDKLPRRRYRNTEWADMCEQIGLMPSSTGLPGGRRVGDNVQTYVIEGGRFDIACSRLVDEAFTLSWVDRFPPRELPEKHQGVVAGQGGDAAFQYDEISSLLAQQSAEDTGEGEEGGSPMASSFTGLGLTSPSLDAQDDEPAPAPAESAPATDSAASVQAPESLKPAPPPMKRYEPVPVESLQQQGIEPREKAKGVSKTAFQCARCGAKAWGKPSLQIGCYGAPDTAHEPQMMAAANNAAKTA